MTRPGRVVLGGVVSAMLSLVAAAGLRSRPPGGAARWERTNHRGDPVTLLEGPALVLGTAATCATATRHPGAAVAVLGAGAFGAWDDLHGDGDRRGLRGHLSALAHGRLTTGAVKIVGLAVTGLGASWLADRERRGTSLGARDTLVGGAVVAAAANVANLFDLRPGRALKVVLTCCAPLLARGSGPAAVAAGASLALLPDDLAGRSMLGDTGANAAGALVGTALLDRTGRRGRVVALGVLTGLTLASERVSFTSVIESTPGLRALDALGRRHPG